MDIRADEANIKVNGNIKKVPVEDVYVDDIIVIRPGEKVPLDGIVLSGSSSLNTSALTGESLPRDVQVGDEVISGCVNVQGLLEVRVTKPASESTVAKILDLMENSSNRKRNTEKLYFRFCKILHTYCCLPCFVRIICCSGYYGSVGQRQLSFTFA